MYKTFCLKNKNGVQIQFSEFGGRIFSIKLPTDKELVDIIVGAPTIDEYLNQDEYMGAICGRYANRIANAQFSIKEETYNLSKNEGENHLHGGFNSFNKAIWKVIPVKLDNFESAYLLKYLSIDGEEGYPGNLEVSVIYALSNENEFHIKFLAKTDKPTIINLTSHPYFNLKGEGTILDHQLFINSEFYTPVNNHNIPTGEIRNVDNTCFDLRKPIELSEIFRKNNLGGFDHNFVLNKKDDTMCLAASLKHIQTGRGIEIFTNQPGIQIYTAQHFNKKMKGKDGLPLQPYNGIAIEPQNFPDAANQKYFPSAVLLPKNSYNRFIIYKMKF